MSCQSLKRFLMFLEIHSHSHDTNYMLKNEEDKYLKKEQVLTCTNAV